jgi:hypothetical protein
MTTSYNMIDRFLRQNLSDKDYPSHKEALDAMCETMLQRTEPPQRTWVGLTDEEKSDLWEVSRAALPRYATYAILIEAKLKQKNGFAEEKNT